MAVTLPNPITLIMDKLPSRPSSIEDLTSFYKTFPMNTMIMIRRLLVACSEPHLQCVFRNVPQVFSHTGVCAVRVRLPAVLPPGVQQDVLVRMS